MRRHWNGDRLNVLRETAVAVLLLLWGSVAPPRVTGQSEEIFSALPPEVQVYELGIREWQERISFFCTYTLEVGTCDSWEAALAGEFRDGGRTVARSHGILCKDGRRIRQSVYYDGGLREVSPPAGIPQAGAGQVVTHVSFDEMTDHEVAIRYEPRERNLNDVVTFSFPEVIQLGPFQPGPLSTGKPNPLSPYGAYRNLTVGFSCALKPCAEYTASVEPLDDSHVRLTIRGNTPGRVEQEQVTTLRTTGETPLVTRIETRWTDYIEPANPKRGEWLVVMDDFVECQGGLFPRKLDALMRGTTGFFMLKRWRSKDLGARPVTDDDFVIEVAETTRFSGLQQPIPAMETRLVRLSDIKRETVGPNVFAALKPRTAEPVVERSEGMLSPRWKMLLFNLLFWIIVGSYYAYTLWKCRGAQS